MGKTMMRIAHGLLLTVGGAILLTGCETTGTMNDSGAGKGEAGWQSVEQAEIAKLFAGNTSVEVTDRWAVHYETDDRKAIWVRNRGTEQRKWWVNDKGEWCETLYADAAERCGARYEKRGDEVRSFDADGNPRFTFRIEKGNSQKL